MNRYQIFNNQSGQNLGEYEAHTAREALNKMAVDAGYSDYDDLLANVPDSYRGELEIRQVDESYKEWIIPYGEITDTGEIVTRNNGIPVWGCPHCGAVFVYTCFCGFATKDG